MKENGELMQLQNKWWVDRSECPAADMESSEADDELSFSSLAGIFYILIIGLVASLIVAVFEFCYFSRRAARKKQVSKTLHQSASQNIFKTKPVIFFGRFHLDKP